MSLIWSTRSSTRYINKTVFRFSTGDYTVGRRTASSISKLFLSRIGLVRMIFSTVWLRLSRTLAIDDDVL